MAHSPNPVFKFASRACQVEVENVSQSVGRHEILKLFNTLIGEVHKCDEYFEQGKRRVFEITFANPDTAKKALCMTGYTVAGLPIAVSASNHEGQRTLKQHGRQTDMRRNLYVLGLPFDLTKSEFVEIFSHYGNVSHAVILATVDNASRRRGFVVMNSHREAKFAMESLSRREIKGYTIDVSWAVVQRSQGFLDGGDRTMVLSSSTSSASGSFESDSWDASPPPSAGLVTPTDVPAVAPVVSTPTLLVANLPRILFSEPADLHPLLCPYGDVTHLKILDENTATEGTISVIVEYKTLAQAQEARDNLSGQYYANRPVQADFFLPKPSSPADGLNLWGAVRSDLKAGLNPHAAPFLVPSSMTQDGMLSTVPSFFCAPALTVIQDGSSAMSFPNSPYVPSPALPSPVYGNTGLFAPQVELLRPRSAPSCSVKGEDEVRPGYWTCSSQTALPTLSSASMRSPFIA